jgi:cellulose synthase/poly-beta-1,6-N-acetylglucosamine synthase-like glycosyltransferase
VVVLIPAHNEHAQIAETITSLLTQTRPPDRVVVVADNCTDETADIARRLGVEVFVTVGNTAKKAGALNQALGRLLPTLADDDRVLVMDADSALDERFLEAADGRLSRGDVAACGGVFLGKPGGGLVGMFQRNEYARYARDVGRLKGKVLVLTGTATMFRAGTLREVARERGTGRLPGAPGAVYDTRVLTEDNELTLALFAPRPRDRLATALPADHRGHAHLARAVAPAAALEARRIGEPRGLRLDSRHSQLLVTPGA